MPTVGTDTDSDDETESDSLPTDPPGTREFGEGELEVVDPNASCMNCAHFGVCGIVNRFAAILDEAANDEPPMGPDALAKICDAYDPEGDDE